MADLLKKLSELNRTFRDKTYIKYLGVPCNNGYLVERLTG